jgi:hypothetical protein
VKQELDHVLRPPLPWRDTNMTECGIDPTGKKVLTNEQFLLRCKEYGQQRTAMVTCMTCLNTVQRWLNSQGLTAQVGREIDRVGGKWYGRGDLQADGGLLENELRAIQLLVNEHREEFDAALAAMTGATSLDQVRARRRYNPR